MKLFVVLGIIVSIFAGWWYWSITANLGTKITTTPKTVGGGEYTTVLGKLRKNIWGRYTVSGYVFNFDDRIYWSCTDSNDVINMNDYVNSSMYYQRKSQDLIPLKELLKTKKIVQVTGELDRTKSLFTSTKVILVHDCSHK